MPAHSGSPPRAANAAAAPPDDGAPAGSPPSSCSSFFNPSNVLLQEADLRALLSCGGAGQRPLAEARRLSPADLALFRQALTHRSYCIASPGAAAAAARRCPAGVVPPQRACGERLEFLGDAVLGLAVAAYLYERYPNEQEGFMTRMRTKIVNGAMLARLCGDTGLARFVLMSRRAESAGGGRERQAALEDAFEAFLGALHLRRGFAAAADWLVRVLESHVDFAALVASQNSPKDVLNRYFLRTHGCLPAFVGPQDGARDGEGDDGDPANNRASVVCVRNRDGAVIATGRGACRRDAENDAARRALLYLGVDASC
jgi:ribonuclease III